MSPASPPFSSSSTAHRSPTESVTILRSSEVLEHSGAYSTPTSIPDHPKENVYLQLSELSELDIVAASYIEPDTVTRVQLETARRDASITKPIANLVGNVEDIRLTAETFFNTTHTWLPIVSKEQFHNHLLEKLAVQRSDIILLILSMKLLTSRVLVARSVLYRTVKQLYFDIESSGRLSVPVLQAAILVAVYELGHGVYPAVILSVGNCARIGVLLGLETYLTVPGGIPGVPWIEHEERRRIWWAILLLDR